MKENKRKVLHYRKATFQHSIGRTLQDLLEEAIRKRALVKERIRLLNDGSDDGWQQFINTSRSALGMEFGNLVLYAPGQNRQTITIDDQAQELDIEQISPPSGTDGKKRQFLESLLFYGVSGDHVILLQSMALRAREFEGYLNHFLQEAGVLSNDNAVYLNNHVTPATQERLSGSEVKSVRIGTPLIETILGAAEQPASARQPHPSPSTQKSLSFRPWGEGMNVLKLLAGDRLNGINWSNLQADNNLQVFVEVTYSRQTDEKSQSLLNDVTSALRHVSDDDVRIELKGGGTVIGSELQVKGYQSIVTYRGIVDLQDLFEKMNSWLIEILQKGLIDPN